MQSIYSTEINAYRTSKDCSLYVKGKIKRDNIIQS